MALMVGAYEEPVIAVREFWKMIDITTRGTSCRRSVSSCVGKEPTCWPFGAVYDKSLGDRKTYSLREELFINPGED